VKTATRFFTILLFILFTLFTSGYLKAQVKFSLASDLSVLHNFDRQQAFTAFGQTVQGLWHLDEKNTLYTWFSYHTNGKFKNDLSASALSAVTQPQTLLFNSRSEIKLRQLSVGIRRYLLGSYKKLEKFNLYGAAGFGLMIGLASNNFSIPVDTMLYTVQNKLVSGSGNFKRLSMDLTAGWEFPLAYEIFIYSEGRLYIPTTDYPNNYLLKNNNTPFPGSIHLGIRVLFNYDR